MKKTKTIFLVITLLLAFSVVVFAENENTVRPDDRMTYRFIRGFIVKFTFKNTIYKMKTAEFLFRNVSRKAYNTFKLGLKLREEGYFKKFRTKVIEAVLMFNDFIAKSSANRREITKAINNHIANPNPDTSSGNDDSGSLLFLGPNLTIQGDAAGVADDIHVSFSLGLKLLYFSTKYDIGFSFTANHNIESDTHKQDGKSAYYLELEPVFKFGSLDIGSNFCVGLGATFKIFLKNDNKLPTEAYKKFIYGGIIEAGYYYVARTLKTCFYANLVFKITNVHLNNDYISAINSNKMSFWWGVNIGILLNLN